MAGTIALFNFPREKWVCCGPPDEILGPAPSIVDPGTKVPNLLDRYILRRTMPFGTTIERSVGAPGW